ncbi:MAG: DUF3562 domain-containing protein [Pseudomonadota bacterium]|nr:DUF3562 domain-containing protein [Pseudomonadota bacterium]
MSDDAIRPNDVTSREADVELLARETAMPIETVNEIYDIEHAKLEQTARIKTYIPLLTRRHVKEVLQTLRASA